MLSKLPLLSAGLALLAGMGCGDLRDAKRTPSPRPAATYIKDIQPLIADRCVSCHSGKTPSADYDLSSWRGLLGVGRDLVRNAIPGDDQSLLLVKAASKADGIHQEILSADELALLRRWVVDEEMAYFGPGYHPAGWLYPGDRNSVAFHGGALRAQAWDMTSCKQCHGADLKGGESGKSCSSCHSEGPTSCNTCHGGANASAWSDLSWKIDPLSATGAGAHQVHLTDSVFGALDCSNCHKTPTDWLDEGHLFDGKDEKGMPTSDLKAEVTLSARSSLHEVDASYSSDGTCASYCHGASFEDPRPAPAWSAGPTGKCDFCHSVPAKFGGPDCSNCHPEVVERCEPGSDGDTTCLQTADGVGVRFFDPANHGDGTLVIGRKGAEGTCWSCHGTEATSGGPGPDLSGNTEISAVGVGLHQIHLAAGIFRGPISCDACHAVPTKKEDAGHMDSDLPAEIVFGDLAKGALRGLDTKPSWDREQKTCSNVACHSLGAGAVTSWTWTAKVDGSMFCGSCHGLPPDKRLDGKSHTVSTTCALSGCHAPAYDSEGKLDLSKHINGTVELGQ